MATFYSSPKASSTSDFTNPTLQRGDKRMEFLSYIQIQIKHNLFWSFIDTTRFFILLFKYQDLEQLTWNEPSNNSPFQKKKSEQAWHNQG